MEIHNYGKCVISAKTVDGSGLIATCAVNVYSGIEEIIAESNKKWSLYNLQGILVKSELSQDDIRHISPGIYILHSGNKVVKIKI